jgi:phenylacetate-CoA ligase
MAFLKKSDRWNADRIARWQLVQLNRLLSHAVRHCPGHQRKLQAVGCNGRIKGLEELAALPFFTKDELRTNGDEFTANNFAPDALRAITSGGTTGTPTRFMVEALTYDPVFAAWIHSIWQRAGYTLGRRCLDITWAFLENGPLRESHEPGRMYLSIHALDVDSLNTWWRRVQDFRPEFVVGFPSTAVALAKLLPASGALPDVKALLLASETLTADQRAVIMTAFPNARIFQWYGMSEMAGFASGCEQADTFHHWPQSGVLEVIGEKDQPLSRPGEVGEIVLTGFLNFATPFIRYRTGDRGVLGDRCPLCNRPHVILEAIEGRLGDFLLGRQRRVVPISALNFHGDEFRHVFAHQFVQDEPGRVVLRLVSLPGFTEKDATVIRRLVGEKLGPDLQLTLEPVVSIPRTPRGKQPLILQRCPPAQPNSEVSSGSLAR